MGYAMVYVYTDQNTLYNAKILKEGKLVLDSTMNKKALEYNNLAESQAYAKQTFAGVLGRIKKHAELGKNLSFHISTSYDRLYSNVEASIFLLHKPLYWLVFLYL